MHGWGGRQGGFPWAESTSAETFSKVPASLLGVARLDGAPRPLTSDIGIGLEMSTISTRPD
jgi:hypothetical protein